MIIYVGNKSPKTELEQLEGINSVHCFNNPLSAISFISRQTNLLAVFYETEMKNIESWHFLQLLHSSTKHDRPLFFIVTENSSLHLMKKYLAKGVNDIFELPLNIEAIQSRLNFLTKYKHLLWETSPKETDYSLSVPSAKRVFDILVSSIALIFLSPLFLLTAALLKLESNAPIFYTSKRVGMGYRIFNFYKFRSMIPDADKKIKEMQEVNQYDESDLQLVGESEAHCTNCIKKNSCGLYLYHDEGIVCEQMYLNMKRKEAERAFNKFTNDPRVTRIGRFIRKTSIDELPQLINVLKGDMSIVGNRPLPVYEAEKLTMDESVERFFAPAGITGLWQVKKRGRTERMSVDERKELDNQYARKYSLWFDVKLLFQTIPAVFQKEAV